MDLVLLNKLNVTVTYWFSVIAIGSSCKCTDSLLGCGHPMIPTQR